MKTLLQLVAVAFLSSIALADGPKYTPQSIPEVADRNKLPVAKAERFRDYQERMKQRRQRSKPEAIANQPLMKRMSWFAWRDIPQLGMIGGASVFGGVEGWEKRVLEHNRRTGMLLNSPRRW